MPVIVKPCNGAFSPETIELLHRNLERAQWQPHPCQVCGQQVEARQHLGSWLPATHWPSIPPRPPISARTPSRKQRLQAEKATAEVDT